MPAALKWGEEIRVRVLACREYIEVSINDEVLISAATYKTPSGRFALWVEEGKASFSALHIQPLSPPVQE
jgi:hypothetical protein